MREKKEPVWIIDFIREPKPDSSELKPLIDNAADQLIHEMNFKETFKDIKFFTMLGKGYESSAWLCIDKTSGKMFVIKTLFNSTNSLELESSVNEVCQLLKLDYPNIIRIYEAFKSESGELCYTMNPSIEGDLRQEITKWLIQGNLFSDSELLKILTQLVSAICYIHENRMCHWDIKPGNILLVYPLRIILTDFG
jgi:serine/threonine protein kinase